MEGISGKPVEWTSPSIGFLSTSVYAFYGYAPPTLVCRARGLRMRPEIYDEFE